MSPGPQLRDIQLPGEPSVWPLPPGVWALLLLAVMLMFLLTKRWLKARARRRRHRRWLEALHALQQEDGLEPVERVAAASELLRRALLSYAPAATVLEGTAWRTHLQMLGGLAADHPGLTPLAEGPWRPRLSENEARDALDCAQRCLQALLERAE